MKIFDYYPMFWASVGDLFAWFEKRMENSGLEVSREKDYIFGQGEIPILLVAHADTVFNHHDRGKRFPIFHDQKEQLIWSPEGLGADDRAGCLMVEMVLRSGLQPHILITDGEERGGIGASAFISDGGDDALKGLDIKFMLEVDRKGKDEVVYYGCEGKNKKWSDWVEGFGFKHRYGTFSDISSIMGAIGICGANLSAGYFDNHTINERLYYGELDKTIEKVIEMIKQGEKGEKFIFEPGATRAWGRVESFGQDLDYDHDDYGGYTGHSQGGYLCRHCSDPLLASEKDIGTCTECVVMAEHYANGGEML